MYYKIFAILNTLACMAMTLVLYYNVPMDCLISSSVVTNTCTNTSIQCVGTNCYDAMCESLIICPTITVSTNTPWSKNAGSITIQTVIQLLLMLIIPIVNVYKILKRHYL